MSEPSPPQRASEISLDSDKRNRTLDLGPFVGLIFAIILLVECLFFMVLSWWMPACDLDKVEEHWDQERFGQVSFPEISYRRTHSRLPLP